MRNGKKSIKSCIELLDEVNGWMDGWMVDLPSLN